MTTRVPASDPHTAIWPIPARYPLPAFVHRLGCIADGDFYTASGGALRQFDTIFAPNLNLASLIDNAAKEGRDLHIGELGFGTGTNSCVLATRFLELARTPQRLIYTGFERAPVAPSHLPEWLEARGSDQALQPIDLAAPFTSLGVKRYWIDDRVSITVHVGDALTSLEELPYLGVDGWIADGFKSAVNPSMWSQALMRTMARHSNSRARVASWASTGQWRRNLTAVGAEVVRVTGSPATTKRHSISAQMPRTQGRGVERPNADTVEKVLVIGGGLSGASTAHALAVQGVRVTVIDAMRTAGSRLSASLTTLTWPLVGAGNAVRAELVRDGWNYSLEILKRHQECVKGKGVLIAQPTRRQHTLAQRMMSARSQPTDLLIPLKASEMSSVAGCTINGDGYYLPSVVSIDPGALIRRLLDHKNIEQVSATRVLRTARDHVILATDEGDVPLEADAVVVATSGSLLPEKPRSLVSGWLGTTRTYRWDSAINLPLCSTSTLVPHHNGFSLTGEYHSLRSGYRGSRHDMLAKVSPAFASALHVSTSHGVRYSCRDALPLAGRNDHTGIWHIQALGSLGTTWGPLIADDLAARILGTSPLLTTRVRQAISPT